MPKWDSFDDFLIDINRIESIEERQQLVEELLDDEIEWPWIQNNVAAFVYLAPGDVDNVALNLDIIAGDPPFQSLTKIDGTNLWYLKRVFVPDDLLDYMFAINDPLTPLATEENIGERIARHWIPDPLNLKHVGNEFMDVSVLCMPYARPFPDWSAMAVPRGHIFEHTYDSAELGVRDQKLWVYTPPGYDDNPDRDYPMLILMDGQWMIGPIQIPYIADVLIKHGRMQPAIIAMKQSSNQTNRIREYVSNDNHYSAIMNEVVPLLETEYRIDSNNLGIGGVGVGAIAAAHVGLKNPDVISHLIMLSPPLGKGPAQEKLTEYIERFRSAEQLPKRIFQSVGRYEMRKRFYLPGKALESILYEREQADGDVQYQFAELGSGHSLAAFRAIFPEALSHTFPVVEQTDDWDNVEDYDDEPELFEEEIAVAAVVEITEEADGTVDVDETVEIDAEIIEIVDDGVDSLDVTDEIVELEESTVVEVTETAEDIEDVIDNATDELAAAEFAPVDELGEAPDIADEFAEGVESVEEEIDEVYGEFQESVDDATDELPAEIAEDADDVADGVEDEFNEAYGEFQDKVEDVTDELSADIAEGTDELANTLDVSEEISESVESVESTLEDTGDALRDEVEGFTDDVEDELGFTDGDDTDSEKDRET